ncbi:MAG TPA: hypothetical protein VMP68_32240 [Candidatus Eisenbacteria bacterium]|nr:hypothetical protein [Candidatus Eisenbacteria bacterium]
MSLGIGEYAPWSISIIDRFGKIGIFKGYAAELTPDNYADQQTAFSALQAALVPALNPLVIGTFYQTTYGNQNIIGTTPPTNNDALRGVKLRILARDSTTQAKKVYSVSAIDPTKFQPLSYTNDYVASTGAEGASVAVQLLVTNFNAFVVNPETGNFMSIYALRIINRGSRRA